MALDRLLHEVKQVGLVTLYFLVCFALVLTLKKLFLAQYAVAFYGVYTALTLLVVVAEKAFQPTGKAEASANR